MKSNHLLKSMMLAVFTIIGTVSTWALTADLSMEYELAGYKAKTFYNLTSNDASVMPESGDLRFRSGYGLFDFGSGNRSADINIPVTETELLVCQFADTQNRGVTINSISGCTKSTTLNDGSHLFFEVNTTVENLNINIGRGGCVVSILVMEKDNEVATADYTLNYLYEGKPVKTVTASGAVGATVLTDASFFADDVKYFRADGQPESFTIAASGNTFNVNVRQAATYNYTLLSSLGATLATGSGFEGEAPRVGYPRYQFVDGKLYEAAADNKEYRKTVALTADNNSVTVNYSEKEGANAVFYVEGENVEGMTVTTAGNIPVRASNALAGVATEDVTITNLPAGKYKLHVGIFASKSGYAEKVVNFAIGNQTFAAAFGAVNLNEVASDEYTLNAAADVKFVAEGTWADAQFDYIWIEKTGDVAVDYLAAAKEALQTAIAIASNINPEGFADAITAAQAALRAEDATAESIAQAAQTLETAIKTYFGEVLPRLGAIVKGLNDSTLNAAYANAQNVLATEGVTPQALAAAMQQIITTAKEVAPEHLQNLRGYAVKYGAGDAVALVDSALAAINAGNVSQIIATMAAVNNAATPIAQQVLGGIISYVQAFGLTEQAIQAKAALESGNYVTMITVAKALFSHLIVAAKDYLPKLGAIVQGLNDSTLNAAYANAQTVLANENVTPENLGAAMQQIIVAAKAVAPAHLQNLRGYAVKYGQEGTAALVDSAVVAINEGNVSKIIATMTAVKEAATPLATNILQQMVRYAQSYAGFEADVTEAQAALRGGNYITMITTAKALYAKLIAAANDYVAKAKAIPTEGKEGVTELNTAISAAEQALTAQDADFSGINTAISNLVAAVKAFEEANANHQTEPAIFTYQKYLIKNIASGRFLGAANNWGTRASLVEHPEYVKLDPTGLPEGQYKLESQVNNGGTAYYFNGDYMDNGNPVTLTITKVGEGVYTIANDANYYGWDGTSTVLGKNLAADSENALWTIQSLDDAKAALATTATNAQPVDATFLIEDHDFGRNNRYQDKWTVEAGNKNLSGGNNTNNCAESYHSVFTISQQLEGAPKGVYALTAQGFYRQDGEDNEHLPYFFANDEKQTFPLMTGAENTMSDASASFSNGLYTIAPIYVEVAEGGTLTIGAKLEGNTALWCIWDNFVLTYYGPDANLDEVKNAAIIKELAELRNKAAELKEQVEVEAVKNAIDEALNATADAAGAEAINAAIATLKAAIANAEVFVNAKTVLAQMKELVDGTNVYTEEALNEYYTQWVAKYEDGTITQAEVAALQNPFLVTGWHANITCDNFLLSAWDTNPDFQDAPYYINSWSTEGENDGSNFKVPFFEYWTGDDNSLGEKTLTATMNGLEADDYTVTAWVRVRIKNGAEAPAYGITLSANDGEAVNVAAGDQVGESQFFLKEFTTVGTVGEDGVLKIQFNIAADNNISWLSFKNVKFEKIPVLAGDANLNGEVTTSDAVAAVSFVLGTETPSAKALKAADMDKSGNITITDVVAIVNTALEIEPEATARGEMKAENVLATNGNAVELMNATTFVGFQMDVTLTNAAMLNGVSLAERAAGLQMAYNRIADNTYRIIAFSTSNVAIEGNEGTLFSLDITGNANINITNIEFADAAAHAYALGFSETTGIKGIYTGATNVESYTVGGIKNDKVRKGMNVVRTADGKVKKVFVK